MFDSYRQVISCLRTTVSLGSKRKEKLHGFHAELRSSRCEIYRLGGFRPCLCLACLFQDDLKFRVLQRSR